MSVVSPARRVLWEASPVWFPFGNTPAHDALEGFDADLPGDSGSLKVLFLGCGDLRNPLTTVTRSGHNGNLQIHVNDNSLAIIGRNVLILKIISSPNFNPEDEEDMAYVWDLWYNATWPQSTLDRFLKDVQSLLSETLPDSVVIPKRSYLEDLRELWKFWFSATKSVTCEKVLEERRKLVANGFTSLMEGIKLGSAWAAISEPIDLAVQIVEKSLLTSHHVNSSQQLRDVHKELLRKVRQEMAEYFKTGISCTQGITTASSVNPTMLQPVTGKWIVHYAACPLKGYLPIALDELENSRKNGGIVFAYCRNELKKLLMAFRERMDHLKFFFHFCDALVFCYEDQPMHGEIKFDVIDTSNLADHVGLANLLNAAARKFRSDQSVLFTESTIWSKVAPELVQYVQDMLCCPLSLIPTMYGLRLMDNVELGRDSPIFYDFSSSPSGAGERVTSRLRWKKALPLDGVPLTPSAALKESVERLKTACFLQRPTPSGVASLSTPLTFHYVLSDLIRREGNHLSKLLDSVLVPQIFRTGLEAIQTWMKQPYDLWKVEIFMSFEPRIQFLHLWSSRAVRPVLRLVLVPISKFVAVAFEGASAVEALLDLTSTEHHIIDQLGLKTKMKPDGGIEEMIFTFLLKDRSLMESHFGIIIDCGTRLPVLLLISKCQKRVEPFDGPFPWTGHRNEPSRWSDSINSKLSGQSCQESERGYNIRLNVVHLGPGTDPKGLKVTTDYDELKLWPCQSAHRITVSLDGVQPLTITLTHPILPDTIKATLRRKDRTVEITVDKALKDLWPDDVLHQDLRWNVEGLRPWTDNESLAAHLQFRYNYVTRNLPGAGMKDDASSPLTRVREIIRTLFFGTLRDGHQFYSLQLKGSTESRPDWYIRTHPPIRMNPRGTPILIVSALDHRLAERLKSQGKFDDHEDFSRIFPAPSEKILPILALTPEEVGLFRYALRMNSTKIWPTSWQSENLPKGERGRPWLATFVRPLYRDGALDDYHPRELQLPASSSPDNSPAVPSVLVFPDSPAECCEEEEPRSEKRRGSAPRYREGALGDDHPHQQLRLPSSPPDSAPSDSPPPVPSVVVPDGPAESCEKKETRSLKRCGQCKAVPCCSVL